MPSATALIAVPPLPGDLQQARPPTPHTGGGEALDDDQHRSAGSAGDVAEAWIVAVFTGRYDDPPGYAAAFIDPLAASPQVAEAAATSLPPLTAAAGEVRWVVVLSLRADGDGWWRADVAVKMTRSGQVGPSTSGVVVRVHLSSEGLVDDWAVS